MASKYLQKFPIPGSFPDLLHDFAREVLRDQPEDIYEFGAAYFKAMEDVSSPTRLNEFRALSLITETRVLPFLHQRTACPHAATTNKWKRAPKSNKTTKRARKKKAKKPSD